MRVVTMWVLGASALLGGCGPTCQSTCNKIYSPSECAVPTPGQEWTDMNRDCEDACEEALTKPGEVGDYDPDERNTTGESIELENERQAALWMDCIAEQACDRLQEGYCEPI
jgi:hypothetical protein